jgi:hypothetical protein
MTGMSVKFRRIGLSAFFVALAICSASKGAASSERRYFVRRGSVVCQNKFDILKVGRTINTMRHFGQIRTLVAEGRCRISSTRRAVSDIGVIERHSINDAVRIRTEDKPHELRWVLRKDVGEFARGFGARR